MDGEAIITLGWKGRLRAFLTGKVTLNESIIRYMLSEMREMRDEGETFRRVAAE